MTTDDLIPLLEQAGICQEVWFEHHRSIERFAALVAAAEREACAKVCFDMAQQHNDIRSAALEMASEYIRARGEA